MHQKYNSISFNPESYDDDINLMWMDIGEVVRMLLKNNYLAVCRQEDFGIVVLDFEFADRDYGCDYPVWLSPSEEDTVIWDSDEAEDKFRREVSDGVRKEIKEKLLTDLRQGVESARNEGRSEEYLRGKESVIMDIADSV